MIQAYSSGLALAAGATIPFNNVVFYKGSSVVPAGAGTFALTKKGVYLVKVDGYGVGDAAGLSGIQVVVNGTARPDAISQATVAAAETVNYSLQCLVVVAQGDCPCDCTSSATTVQVAIPVADTAVTGAHYNIIISKLC